MTKSPDLAFYFWRERGKPRTRAASGSRVKNND